MSNPDEYLRNDTVAPRAVEPKGFRGGRARSFQQDAPQRRPAARQAGLDDILRYPEALRHFRRAEAFDFPKNEYLAHAVRQRVYRPFQQLAQLPGECLPLGFSEGLRDMNGSTFESSSSKASYRP